jgi:Fe-S-cluster containining protein
MEIEDLYKLIPSFHCKAGCIECCVDFGVPSRTHIEEERIMEYVRARGVRRGEATGLRCPYVTAAGCTIYEVRPLICRLYGTSPNYLCRLRVQPVTLLHEDEEDDIFHFYYKHFS